jgi:probable addiction module antidote protein
MGKTITTPWDSADYLLTPEDRAMYLEAMIEETNGDPYWIMKALNTIARSEGMTGVARTSGLSRENLYRSLSGNKKPEFGTILKVMSALGLQFHVVAKPVKVVKVSKTTKPSKAVKVSKAAKVNKVAKSKPVAPAARTRSTALTALARH